MTAIRFEPRLERGKIGGTILDLHQRIRRALVIG